MKQKLGIHVSISGGIHNSVSNALNLGCNAFQIFSRSPRQWSAKELGDAEVSTFKEKLKTSSIETSSVVVHMPYLPNLSAPESEMYQKSVSTLTDEIIRCNLLGIPYLVIHLGSHLGKGEDNGKSQLVKACTKSFIDYESRGLQKNKVKLLLENSAGQKNSIGSNIEQLGEILERLGTQSYGLCLDTCHLYASGYDLSNKSKSLELIDNIDSTLGLENLKLFHLNDSKGGLGSNLDRHHHIGLGKIGPEGFKILINNKKLFDIPFIMETPIDSERGDAENMKYLKSLID
jgi:deoxyribonuclease-4